MRRIFTLAALSISLVASAQVTDMVSMGAGYTNQVFYSLENGEAANVNANDWDIAFRSDAFSASIIVNDNNGTMLYTYSDNVADWDNVDLDDMTWDAMNNSETDWEQGAFSQNGTGTPFDYGWGAYNVITHVVSGTRIFILQLSDGSYKKVIIEALDGGEYTFKYANIDGSDEVQEVVDGADYNTKNFWYYSVSNQQVLDREPAADTWDIMFTRYVSEIFPGTTYLVTGVLQNIGVDVAEADGVPVGSADWNDYDLLSEKNIIGSDWKQFSGSAFEIVQDRSYFVQDLDGDIWQLYFTAFEGTATGNVELGKELVSATGVNEFDQVEFSVFPNPAIDQVTAIVDVENQPIRYSLLNMNGQVVAQDTWYTGFQHSVDVSDLTSGVYLLQIERDGAFGQQRIMVQ